MGKKGKMKTCFNCKKEFQKKDLMLIQAEVYNSQKAKMCKKCADIVLEINTKSYKVLSHQETKYKLKRDDWKGSEKEFDPFYQHVLLYVEKDKVELQKKDSVLQAPEMPKKEAKIKEVAVVE